MDEYFTVRRYRDLRNSVVTLSTRLASLGFTPPHDPVRSYHSFNKLIRSFQSEYLLISQNASIVVCDIARYGAYPDAPGRNVLQALDKLNLGTQSESSITIMGARGVEQCIAAFTNVEIIII